MKSIKVAIDGHLTEVKLRLCPFCGAEPKCNGLPRGMVGQIYCNAEGCFGPKTTAATKADAVAQWNMRAGGVENLARIKEIIEAVDNRCLHADGPVTPTLQEMEQKEISEIYALACGKPESWRPK